MRLRGKIPVFVLGGVAAVVLAAGPAVAHECYNASRSDKGNQQVAANSPAFVTFDESAMGFFRFGLGLCPAGADYLLGQVHAAAASPDSGIDVDWVVSAASLQAGGLEGARIRVRRRTCRTARASITSARTRHSVQCSGRILEPLGSVSCPLNTSAI